MPRQEQARAPYLLPQLTGINGFYSSAPRKEWGCCDQYRYHHCQFYDIRQRHGHDAYLPKPLLLVRVRATRTGGGLVQRPFRRSEDCHIGIHFYFPLVKKPLGYVAAVSVALAPRFEARPTRHTFPW